MGDQIISAPAAPPAATLAPSAPAAPPAAAAAADPTAPSSATHTPDIFGEIDRVAKPNLTETAPEKKEAPAAPPEVKDQTKPDTKPDGEPPAEITDKTAPKQLREAYERLKKQLAEVQAKAPAEPTNILEVKEFKELQEKMTAKEQEAAKIAERAAELEKTVQFLDYEQSAEFKEKYYKPYVEAWKSGQEEFSKLTVPNEDGTPNRKATMDDLTAIVSEPDMERALQLAEDLFKNPTKAGYALQLRDKIIRAANVQDQAKAEFKTKSTEIAKQRTEQQQAALKMERELWNTEIKTWAEKNSAFMTPADGDAKAKELIEIGQKAADMAFADASHLNPQQRAKLYAETRNRAAAFGHVAYKLETATKQIEALTKELEAYKASGPGKGEGAQKPQTAGTFVSMAERLDALAAL